MKQLLQNLKTGVLDTPEIPCRKPRRGEVLVQTHATLISAGTERMLLDFGKANWVQKARLQPDKVRQVLDKIRTDGILPAIESVQAKLDHPISLGYSNVGIVLESDVYKPGTRVVSNGPHAEVVCVPKNFTAAIPESVKDDEAAVTVFGAIALEGIRLLAPTLGETIAVMGLGLIGQLAVQILKAHGCRVLGVDLDGSKVDLAKSFGAESVNLSQGEDPVAVATRMTRDRGVDGVLICAATQSDEPVHQATQLCRKRGRIVLTGVTGLHLSRDDFYKKELTFQVSCSYGPGRYDQAYEQDGQDYPHAYVRWTAQRNFEAVLQLMAEGRLHAGSLITHRFPFTSVHEAYALLDRNEPYLGILLEYPNRDKEQLTQRSVSIVSANAPEPSEECAAAGRNQVVVIGAGTYATKVLLPVLHKAKARIGVIVSSGGVSAQHAARKFGIPTATTDTATLFTDPSILAVVVATRHDSHAHYVCQALSAGQHIFVEKPLALRLTDVDEIERLYAACPQIVMVGFNRRFAPHAQKMRQLLSTTHGPKCVVITVNAGACATDHWTNDTELGGGRLIGEGCHFLDLARFLIARPIVDAHWHTTAHDTATLHLEFDDKSQASIHYFANGYRRYPKERVQVFTEGKILELDNWRKLRGYGWKRFERLNLWRQDKGNVACLESWLTAIKNNGQSPIPFDEILEVTRWTLRAVQK
jgi:predicted dehydrogenase/threonine dehydrogenase-like Zn-dependent dehydrogenase